MSVKTKSSEVQVNSEVRKFLVLIILNEHEFVNNCNFCVYFVFFFCIKKAKLYLSFVLKKTTSEVKSIFSWKTWLFILHLIQNQRSMKEKCSEKWTTKSELLFRYSYLNSVHFRSLIYLHLLKNSS